MPHFNHAFITGASSGIGRALCLELARRGTHVVAVARREQRLRELFDEIRAQGGQADFCTLDVRDHSALVRSMREQDAASGGLDLVIANAGVGNKVSEQALTWEQVETVVAVNFTAAVATLIEGKQLMSPRGRGRLVGISSLAGLRAMPGAGVYSATKAGLQTFLETLELDLEGTGLRVTDIQPGFVRSEITDSNDFEMPFLWEAERAARRIAAGLEAGQSVIRFPAPLAWPLCFLARSLPRPVWRWVTSGLKPKRP